MFGGPNWPFDCIVFNLDTKFSWGRFLKDDLLVYWVHIVNTTMISQLLNIILSRWIEFTFGFNTIANNRDD